MQMNFETWILLAIIVIIVTVVTMGLSGLVTSIDVVTAC